MEMDNCTAKYLTICSDSCCIGGHIAHKKSSHLNYPDFSRIFDSVLSRLGILVYTAEVCNFWVDEYGVEKHGIVGGLAGVSARTSMVYIKPGGNDIHILNVRIMQHELSHNFGMNYNVACNAACIMSGGFDSNPSFSTSDIWCDNHAGQFNRNLH